MITLQVRGERGQLVLRGERRLDWERLQLINEEDFPYLGSLLPYADTMFNARQAVRVRRELEDQRVLELLGNDSAAEIERLCLLVEAGPHLYLWFLGD